MDAIDRADLDARVVLLPDAGLCDDVGQGRSLSFGYRCRAIPVGAERGILGSLLAMILLTGGTGVVGTALLPQLLERGATRSAAWSAIRAGSAPSESRSSSRSPTSTRRSAGPPPRAPRRRHGDPPRCGDPRSAAAAGRGDHRARHRTGCCAAPSRPASSASSSSARSAPPSSSAPASSARRRWPSGPCSTPSSRRRLRPLDHLRPRRPLGDAGCAACAAAAAVRSRARASRATSRSGPTTPPAASLAELGPEAQRPPLRYAQLAGPPKELSDTASDTIEPERGDGRPTLPRVGARGAQALVARRGARGAESPRVDGAERGASPPASGNGGRAASAGVGWRPRAESRRPGPGSTEPEPCARDEPGQR